MKASIPAVEISHDRDARRRGRPNGKGRSLHIIDRANMRSELFINPVLVALCKEVQIKIPKCREKRIRIEILASLTVTEGGAQLIAKDPFAAWNKHFEKALRRDQFH